MTDPGDEDTRRRTVARGREQIIDDAQKKLHRAAEEYIGAANTLDRDDELGVKAAQLHNAVISYYRSLAPLKHEPAVADYWQTARLWPRGDGSGKQVCGLDELRKWMFNVQERTETSVGFTGQQKQTRREPRRLPPRYALLAADRLHRAAVELGFKPPTESENDDAGFEYADVLEEGPPDNGEKPTIQTDGGDDA